MVCMKFCTVINCMDGRVQLPVITYLQKRFNAEYVDSITEPGPVRILADQQPQHLVESILIRLNISVDKHGSGQLAVVGHHGCAGNPVEKEIQVQQVKDSIRFLQRQFETLEIIGLWVNEHWQVEEL